MLYFYFKYFSTLQYYVAEVGALLQLSQNAYCDLLFYYRHYGTGFRCNNTTHFRVEWTSGQYRIYVYTKHGLYIVFFPVERTFECSHLHHIAALGIGEEKR